MSYLSFTDEDHLIIKSYESLVYGIADYLGSECEVVLHSLHDYNQSAVVIANGHHSGRKVGAPITDLALRMLKELENSGAKQSKSYFTRGKNGQLLKSSTIAIRGKENKIIALLCINMNLDGSLSNFLNTFSPNQLLSPENNVKENFANSVEDLLKNTIETTIYEIDASQEIPHHNRNKEIIRLLLERGVFQMRDSVAIVSNALKISKHTVYLHLRNYNNNQGED
jgi:predicted transcriptional regulator YheO